MIKELKNCDDAGFWGRSCARLVQKNKKLTQQLADQQKLIEQLVGVLERSKHSFNTEEINATLDALTAKKGSRR